MMLAVVAASVSFASCGTSAADKAKADSIAAAAKADSIAAAEEAAAAAAAACCRRLARCRLCRCCGVSSGDRLAKHRSLNKGSSAERGPFIFLFLREDAEGVRRWECRKRWSPAFAVSRYPERYGRVSGMLRSDGSRTCGGTPGPAPKSGTVRNVKRGCPTRISRAASSLSSFCGPIATWRSSVPGLRGGS